MKIKSIKFIMTIILIWLSSLSLANQNNEYIITSPDTLVNVLFYMEEGTLNYKVSWKNQLFIDSSEITLFTDSEVEILDAVRQSHDTVWKPVWGQFSEIRNNYNEFVLSMDMEGIKGQFIIRVFNDGIGFRFKVDNIKNNAEVLFSVDHNLSSSDKLFFTAGEKEPVGPIALQELVSADEISKFAVPLVVEKSNEKYMAILESDLYLANGFNAMDFAINQQKKRVVSVNKIKKYSEEIITPWRVILFGDNVGDLVTNTVALNLATPCQLENTEWINPGKSLWDWRVYGYKAHDGFTYGNDTQSYKRFIDFASKNSIEYFLIDDAWYKNVSKGHFDIAANLDMNEVSEYASEKGVELILYYDRKHGQYGDDELFPYYQSLGMKGIKYGFMGRNVEFSREAIKKSAKSELLINFHDGPVPFTGIRRTFPNAVTREYCHAQQDSRRAFTPESFIKMALISAIQGPLDMNNGNFDIVNINNGLREKGPIKRDSYYTTVVSEAARTLIIFSGLVCLPDAPEAYTDKIDLFEFIQRQPTGKWDETRILNSKIGEYITTARRHDEEWFVASVISQKGGSLDIKLDFLQEEQIYEATFYEDTEETHCKTNPEAYKIRKAEVKKDQLIHAKMAPGGGHCIWIRPIKSSSAQSSKNELNSFNAAMSSKSVNDKESQKENNKGIIKQVGNKPNIVLIVVDDLGYSDVGYMNQKEGIQTPNIDKLAKNGMVFTDAYAAAPVCSPTRASLLTGKYPATIKITCHVPGMGMEKYLAKLNEGKKLKEAFFLDYLPLEETTIAEVLKEQGYTTGYIGKWHLGGEGSAYTENGIVDARYHPDKQGFDINIGGCAYGQPKSYFSPYKNGTLKDGPKGEYLTDRLGDEAVSFIEENKAKPFFLNLATYTVHTPLAAPPDIVEKYDGNKYFAMIEKLDQNVGKVIDKLEELSLLENTLVIFYSDNGGLWGNSPLKGIKGTLNEGGIRVPLIFSWPNKIEGGITNNTPVTSVDFFPTILELANISTLDFTQLEGASLLPLLTEKDILKERPIYWHFPHHRKEGLSMGAAIRLGKWKYIMEFETDKEYLYNLKEDISENKNMINKYPEKIHELSKMLQKWQKEVGAEMPEPNKKD